jgi:hypothetical protein
MAECHQGKSLSISNHVIGWTVALAEIGSNGLDYDQFRSSSYAT